jgi:hypothetical protein
MKKINTLLLALFATCNIFAQQELSLFFTQELGQSKRVNPALDHPYNVHVGLLSPNFSFHNSAFSLNDIFTKDGRVWTFNPETTLTDLDVDRNDVRLSSNVETLSVGFNIGKFQINLFHNVNFDANLMYPKALLEIAWHGNTFYLGETVNIAPSLDLMSYHEFGAGVAVNITDELRVGGNLKYLQGMVNLRTQHAMLNFYTDAQNYELQVSSDIYFNSSGLASDFYKSENDDVFPSKSSVTFLFNANRGVAADFGAVYQLNDQLQLSFSALDIGAILWKSSVYSHRSKGAYTFGGVDVNPFRSSSDVELSEVSDSLASGLELTATGEIYTTFLMPKFYLSGNYNLGNGLNAGALIYNDIYQGRVNPAFALSLRKQFGRILHLGTLVGMHTRSKPNIGLNGTLALGPVQLFFITDNLPSVISLSNGQNTSIRFGLNLTFNNKTKEEKAMEAIQKLSSEAPKLPETEEELVPIFFNPWIGASSELQND